MLVDPQINFQFSFFLFLLFIAIGLKQIKTFTPKVRKISLYKPVVIKNLTFQSSEFLKTFIRICLQISWTLFYLNCMILKTYDLNFIKLYESIPLRFDRVCESTSTGCLARQHRSGTLWESGRTTRRHQ